MSNQTKGDAIRLTNKTAKSLREQARQQQTALFILATVLSVILCAAAVVVGMAHLIAVPVFVLITIAIDTLILISARSRYLSLTGQAICTEAAARQLRGESAEMKRVKTAQRDLQRIKEDLSLNAYRDEDEDDEDMYSPAPVRKKAQKPQPVRILEEEDDDDEQGTREVQPVSRRRRRTRLTVIGGEGDHRAN